MTTDKFSASHLNRMFLSKLPMDELELKRKLLHEALNDAKNSNDSAAVQYLNKWLEEVQGAIQIQDWTRD
jgi:hypothetical protein